MERHDVYIMGGTDDNRQNNGLQEDIIAGRNAVLEALRSGRPIDKVMVAKGERSGSILSLLAQCRQRNITVKDIDGRRLSSLAGPNHQGIAAVAACKEYASLDDIFEVAKSREEPPFIVVCDRLEDPHNLGAVIRTAEAAGVHGVIIPKRHSAGLTSAVYKASAGAVEYMTVARVANISDTLRELKKRGVWVYGLDMKGSAWCKTDLRSAVAVVVGSEGKGLKRLVSEQCDYILSLPMLGHVESLNASVACGIVLFEAVRQRQGLAD